MSVASRRALLLDMCDFEGGRTLWGMLLNIEFKGQPKERQFFLLYFYAN